MWPDRVSNSGPLTYESDALPTALRGPVLLGQQTTSQKILFDPLAKIAVLQIRRVTKII